jgi:hypothetical protein
MSDAKFEDGSEEPLALLAMDEADLSILSTFVQDAVLTAEDMRFAQKRREFGMLLNRFRWEDREAAERAGRPFERVRAVLMFRDVKAVRSQGIHQREDGTVLSLLSVGFVAGEDGMGKVVLTLAGDGVVELDVEALDATLRDVTRPYLAPSRKAPGHPG